MAGPRVRGLARSGRAARSRVGGGGRSRGTGGRRVGGRSELRQGPETGLTHTKCYGRRGNCEGPECPLTGKALQREQNQTCEGREDPARLLGDDLSDLSSRR